MNLKPSYYLIFSHKTSICNDLMNLIDGGGVWNLSLLVNFSSFQPKKLRIFGRETVKDKYWAHKKKTFEMYVAELVHTKLNHACFGGKKK